MKRPEHVTSDLKSALTIAEGIEQPQVVDSRSVIDLKSRIKKEFSSQYYLDGIHEGNRTILSQAITIVESNKPRHQVIANQILEKCISESGNSFRIGITGVPGAGKSTFIETFGLHLVSQGKKIAVLAIDPSSEKSKGSILGDKTRMEQLATNKNAYIRPSPSSGSLGGVARKTKEVMILCEAAGFDTILVETVGVGQSETTVSQLVDFFLLLMLSGAGDELQGIKRGIMEMADMIVITKADGANKEKAQMARAQYQSTLQLFPPASSGWKPVALTCSAILGEGIDTIWDFMQDYFVRAIDSNFLVNRRNIQAKHWMHETITDYLKMGFYGIQEIKTKINELEVAIQSNQMSGFQAAQTLIDTYINFKK